MNDGEDREREKIEAAREETRDEYQRMLKNSVSFEKRIRDRWRDKNRRKSERISELEARIEELERRLAED